MPAPTTLEELRAKYTPRMSDKELKKVTPNSRYLLIHFLYNILALPKARNTAKGKLPATDAATMERFTHPFCGKLTRWRSDSRALQSIANARSYCRPATAFSGDVQTPTGEKAIFWFNVTGHDNIERCFPLSERSIPINLHKPGRDAFITPPATVATSDIVAADPANLDLLTQLISGEKAKVRVSEVEA